MKIMRQFSKRNENENESYDCSRQGSLVGRDLMIVCDQT